MAPPTHEPDPSEDVATSTLVLDTSEDEVDIQSITWLLRTGAERRVLVFIHDDPASDPLERFADVVAQCRAAGVQVVVRTSDEEARVEARGLLAINRQKLGSPGSDAAIDEALRAGPRQAPQLPGTDALAGQYVQPQDLPKEPASKAAPDGPMVAHLGDRLTPAQLEDEDMLISAELAARIRAWPVRTLVGTVFVAEAQADLGRALQTHVQRLLGVPVRVPNERGFGGPGKYMHVHTSASTPPDSSTGAPMFLELYGHIAVVGEHDLRTLDGALWLRQARREAAREHHGFARLPGRLVVRLEAATWANVSYPGFDVPFYM